RDQIALAARREGDDQPHHFRGKSLRRSQWARHRQGAARDGPQHRTPFHHLRLSILPRTLGNGCAAPAGAPRATAAANSDTVGQSNSISMPTETPRAESTAVSTCVALNESPPRSKKLSRLPTVGTLSTSAKIRAISVSSRPIGGSLCWIVRATSAASSLRSILPEDARGNCATSMIRAGIL